MAGRNLSNKISRAISGIRSIHYSNINNGGRRERAIIANTWGITQSWSSRGGVKSHDLSLIQDMYIRKFIFGTFPGVFHIIEQKRSNSIVISFWLKLSAYEYTAPSLSFLVSFSETILTNWIGCNVKIVIRGYHNIPTNKLQHD